MLGRVPRLLRVLWLGGTFSIVLASWGAVPHDDHAGRALTMLPAMVGIFRPVTATMFVTAGSIRFADLALHLVGRQLCGRRYDDRRPGIGHHDRSAKDHGRV
jgi:hypothetical protein